MPRIYKTIPLEIRFWNRILKTANNCWEWQGSTTTTGYGKIYYKGKLVCTSRLAWLLTHGPIGDKLVCHKCDNKLCINPNHLFLGTHKDNTKDCIKKGRFSMHGAKLTYDTVQTIRDIYTTQTITQKQLASEYQISQSQISNIIREKRWPSTKLEVTVSGLG